MLRDGLVADVLIIGSGLAGALLALCLSENPDTRILLASKDRIAESNSAYAQGGLAAVKPPAGFDTTWLHLADTVKAGDGLTDVEVASGIIEDGRLLLDKLESIGVEFDRNDGDPDLALEGGHCRARVWHVQACTGRAITGALLETLQARASRPGSNLFLWENATAIDLLIRDGQCLGATFLMADEPVIVNAAETVIATGGAGRIYSRTTNPAIATGDGIAMAGRAGAALANLEFVQFHPTALALEGAPAFLITEALRGRGARLQSPSGEYFMSRFHEDAELATRDIVARGIRQIMDETGSRHVYLDLRPVGRTHLSSEFGPTLEFCRAHGLDARQEPIPVSPAAHYFMGGILTDNQGRTNLQNLYSIGEAACNGLHGANRLASNSLLEAGVMALRLHSLLSRSRAKRWHYKGETPEVRPVPEDSSELALLMYEGAGISREASGLESIIRYEKVFATQKLTRNTIEASNMLYLSRLIARGALLRKESRGAHFRRDYPSRDEVGRILICINESMQMKITNGSKNATLAASARRASLD